VLSSSSKPARGLFLFTTINLALILLFAGVLRYNYLQLKHSHAVGTSVSHAAGAGIFRGSFPDLLDYPEQFRFFHSTAFFHQSTILMYPAPLALPYRFFFFFGSYAAPALVAALLLLFTAMVVILARTLIRRGLQPPLAVRFVLLTLLFAWPVWFCLKQGNFEFLIFGFIAAGVYAFWHRNPYLAAFCFAVAGSMKIYPLIFLGLLLAARRYRAFFLGLATTAGILLLSLWLECPDIAVSWHGMTAGLAAFFSAYVTHYQIAQCGLDHSLFGLVKLGLAASGHMDWMNNVARMGHLAYAYLAVVALSGLTLWIIRIRHLPPVNQVLALTVAAIMLPPVSFEYTLMHLYIPWVMLVLLAIQGREAVFSGRRPLLVAYVFIAVLVSPLTEFWFHGWGMGGEMKAVLLLLLFILALKFPFPETETTA
jgi:hypothetical protein